MVDIISQAQSEMNQSSRKIKLFQKEVNNLKSDNQTLRSKLDQVFQENV